MKISDVAKEVGVTSGTLRLWEQYGVLTPIRAPSGHRRSYAFQQLDTARQIAQLRNTSGLSLAEIKSAFDQTAPPQLPSEPTSPGQVIRKMRLERKMSIKALAGELGVSVSTPVIERSAASTS